MYNMYTTPMITLKVLKVSLITLTNRAYSLHLPTNFLSKFDARLPKHFPQNRGSSDHLDLNFVVSEASPSAKLQRQYYCLSPTTLACFANCCCCMKLVLRAAFVSSGYLVLRHLKQGVTCTDIKTC